MVLLVKRWIMYRTEYYDKILAIDPHNVNALGKLGKSLESIQLYQRAIKLLQSNQTSTTCKITLRIYIRKLRFKHSKRRFSRQWTKSKNRHNANESCRGICRCKTSTIRPSNCYLHSNPTR